MKRLLVVILFFATTFTFAQSMFNRSVPAAGTDTYTTNILGFTTYNNSVCYIKFANTNTDAATLTVGALGAIPIRKWDGSAWQVLAGGEIDVNTVYKLSYSGSYYELEGLGGGGSALTDGKGTTGNGTAVDLGGITDSDINIDAVSGTESFNIGENTNFYQINVHSSNSTGIISEENVQLSAPVISFSASDHIEISNTIPNDETLEEILVYDPSTQYLKYRTVTSLPFIKTAGSSVLTNDAHIDVAGYYFEIGNTTDAIKGSWYYDDWYVNGYASGSQMRFYQGTSISDGFMEFKTNNYYNKLILGNNGSDVGFTIYTGTASSDERIFFSDDGTVRLTLPGGGSAGDVITLDEDGYLIYSPSGGAITNGAADTELMMSDGTNAVSSGIYIPSNSNMDFGDASTSGSTRILSAVGVGADVGFLMEAQGSAYPLVLKNGTNSLSLAYSGIYQGGSSTGIDFTIKATNVTGSSTANSVRINGGQAVNGYGGNVRLVAGGYSGSGKIGNIQLGGVALAINGASWQGMEGGINIQNVVTEPSAAISGGISIYSVLDSSETTLGIYASKAVASDAALVSTHSLRIKINGTIYKLMLAAP